MSERRHPWGSRLLKEAGLLVPAVLAAVLLGGWQVAEAAPKFGSRPDFQAIEDVPQLKTTFFGYLQPMVEHHNEQISSDRKKLNELQAALEDGDDKLGAFKRRRLADLAERYKIDTDGIDERAQVARLMRRVDVIPVELALVQAAKESGWGRSRFSVEANNLFGQWCYERGCGLVPAGRSADATHEVQRFDSFFDAIGSYMNNLNTHSAYQPLRGIRANLRDRGVVVTGEDLAPGLINYSQRRQAYVDEVLVMLRQYHQLEKPK